MNKKLWALCLVVAMGVSAVAGAAFAYYVAVDSDIDTFTMGKVSVEVIQSQYDRVNSDALKVQDVTLDGVAGDSVVSTDIQAINSNYFTNDQIIGASDYDKTDEDGAYTSYYDDVIGDDGLDIGDVVNICPYVLNDGTVAVYARIVILTEASHIDDGIFKIKNNGKINTYETDYDLDYANSKASKVTIDGTEYWKYVVTYENILEPDEMTFYNAFTVLEITNSLEQELNIEIYAEAIQAEGFDSAMDAFAEYDK